MSNFGWKDIYDASLNLLFPLNLEETYKVAVEEAKKLLNASHGTILRMENGQLTRVYATSKALLNSYVSQHGRTRNVFDTKEPYFFEINKPNDVHNDQWRFKMKFVTLIPLSYEDRVIGVLNIFSKKTLTFSDEQLLMLKFFGSLISQAIYKAEEYKKTQEAVVARDLFIAMASHELKTPLTSMLLYTEMIRHQIKENKIPTASYVENLHKQTKWLSELTNQLLQVNIVKKGKLTYQKEKVSLLEIINVATNSFHKSYTKHNLIFDNKVKEEPYVNGDYYKLLQVVINIINNAVKFSQDGTSINITLSENTHQYVLSIKDQGSGISKRDIAKIFEGFYKGGNKQHEGMGLGLYLVKEIITHHDGTINVESEPSKGTTVTIKLPMYERG